MHILLNTLKPGHESQMIQDFAGPQATPESRQHVIDYIQHHSKRYGDLITGKRPLAQGEIVRDFSSADRFPTNDPTTPTVLFQTADRLMADPSWTILYSVRDFRNTREESFDIADVYDAVTFEVLPEGESIKVAGVRGSEANFKFQNVGGGFQFDINWLKDNKFWRLENGLAAMNARYALKQQALAWSVATASGLSTTTRDTVGANTVEKDVNTINAGCAEILSALQSATDGDGNVIDERLMNPGFVLAYNSLTAGYVGRAQAIQAASFNAPNATTGGKQLAYPVQFVGNPDVPTGNFYLFLPGRKFVAGIRQDLEVFEHFDPYKLTESRPGYGRYRMVRGDAKQGRIIPLA